MPVPRFSLLILVALTLTSWQCQKEKGSLTLKEDHLIFGYINCFAPTDSDCVRLFLLQDGQLFADAVQRPEQAYAFHSTPMGEAAFQTAIQAWTDMPQYLWDHPNSMQGCPNCVDQGTLVIATKKNGITYKWDLDPMEAALPTEIRPYVTMLKTILEALP
jgi:hypothetical protein